MNDFSWRKFFFILAVSQSCFVFSESLTSTYNSTQAKSEDFIVPNLQPENDWIEQEQAQKRLLEEENQRMIENDSRMMEQEYDPNETTEGFLKSDINSKFPRQKSVLEGDANYESNGK